MDQGFLTALKRFESFGPSEVAPTLFGLFQAVTEMDIDEVIAAWQTLHFFWKEMEGRADRQTMERLGRVRMSLLTQIIENHVYRADTFNVLPGLSKELLVSLRQEGSSLTDVDIRW